MTDPPPLARRRRSAPDTRRAIAEAALALFAESGFDGVGIRAIANAVGVDAALVIRYFGSKEELFLEVMTLDLPAAAVLAGPLETLGRALVEHVLDLSAGSRSAPLATTSLAALLRASDRERVRQRLLDTIESTFATPLVGRLTGPDARLRAHLVAAQIGGLLTSLHVVGDPVLRAGDHERVARHYGAAIQSLVDG